MMSSGKKPICDLWTLLKAQQRNIDECKSRLMKLKGNNSFVLNFFTHWCFEMKQHFLENIERRLFFSGFKLVNISHNYCINLFCIWTFWRRYRLYDYSDVLVKCEQSSEMQHLFNNFFFFLKIIFFRLFKHFWQCGDRKCMERERVSFW